MGTESNESSPETANERPVPLSDALKEVIANLKGQPLLLCLLGIGILFVIAGSTVKTLPAILPSLGMIFILGIAIWGFIEIQKIQHGKITSGDVKVGRGVKAQTSEAQSGGVSGAAKGASQAASGNIVIGDKADLKGVKMKTGDVKFGGGNPKDEKGK
jgi:hypothetical protein